MKPELLAEICDYCIDLERGQLVPDPLRGSYSDGHNASYSVSINGLKFEILYLNENEHTWLNPELQTISVLGEDDDEDAEIWNKSTNTMFPGPWEGAIDRLEAEMLPWLQSHKENTEKAKLAAEKASEESKKRTLDKYAAKHATKPKKPSKKRKSTPKDLNETKSPLLQAMEEIP